jgi:hypothetical protein
VRTIGRAIGPACSLALLFGAIGSAGADDAKAPYPAMAPLAQYQVASPADEIALARSAAPVSVSGDADVLVLGKTGYDRAVTGKNGFVCLVERSWASGLDDPGFWNPKLRAPQCLNAAAARTVLPAYLERTKWVLAGVSLPDIIARTPSDVVASAEPALGAMCYMMSKQQYLSDSGHNWHPHLMFYIAHADAASWGADLPGSPVDSGKGKFDPFITYFVPIAKWSDGTSAVMEMH